MKSLALVCLAMLALVLELSGCGSPPPPPRSAKAEINSAELAIQSGDDLCKRKAYDQAKGEYQRAIDEITKAKEFAGGIDNSRLGELMKDALARKFTCEQNVRRLANEAALKPKTTNAPAVETKPTVDPEVVKQDLEKARAAKAQAEEKDALKLSNNTKKKVDEPEDAGELAAGSKPKEKPKAGEAPEADPVAKAPLKDKAGIFPNVTDSSPPLQVVKLTRVGKFVVAYVQLVNKSDDGKRLSVSNLFKTTDNQTAIDPRTAHSYPYQGFSLKVKDLIADQSVRTFTANSEEIHGNDYMQFVSVGECLTEEAALKVSKLYISIVFSDGKTIDATGPEGTTVGGALDKALPKLLK